MRKVKNYFRKKPHMVLSVPTVLCFITFITNLIKALSDGNIDANEFHGLLASADGFEATVMFMVMLVLKNKKK
jgi:hypothetical protein